MFVPVRWWQYLENDQVATQTNTQLQTMKISQHLPRCTSAYYSNTFKRMVIDGKVRISSKSKWNINFNKKQWINVDRNVTAEVVGTSCNRWENLTNWKKWISYWNSNQAPLLDKLYRCNLDKLKKNLTLIRVRS